jgi:hypothetical protein
VSKTVVCFQRNIGKLNSICCGEAWGRQFKTTIVSADDAGLE